jgi:hypothetical protein
MDVGCSDVEARDLAACQRYLSFPRNRNQASYTLAGATNPGLPLAYPGADARGVQVGIVHRF